MAGYFREVYISWISWKRRGGSWKWESMKLVSVAQWANMLETKRRQRWNRIGFSSSMSLRFVTIEKYMTSGFDEMDTLYCEPGFVQVISYCNSQLSPIVLKEEVEFKYLLCLYANASITVRCAPDLEGGCGYKRERASHDLWPMAGTFNFFLMEPKKTFNWKIHIHKP